MAAAAGKTVADVIAPDLKVLFVGINPGLYTAAMAHYQMPDLVRLFRELREAAGLPEAR